MLNRCQKFDIDFFQETTTTKAYYVENKIREGYLDFIFSPRVCDENNSNFTLTDVIDLPWLHNHHCFHYSEENVHIHLLLLKIHSFFLTFCVLFYPKPEAQRFISRASLGEHNQPSFIDIPLRFLGTVCLDQ